MCDNSEHHYQLGRRRNVRQGETNGKCKESGKGNVKSDSWALLGRKPSPKRRVTQMSGGTDRVVSTELCVSVTQMNTLEPEVLKVKAGMDL